MNAEVQYKITNIIKKKHLNIWPEVVNVNYRMKFFNMASECSSVLLENDQLSQ
jgi:hypothetical protein